MENNDLLYNYFNTHLLQLDIEKESHSEFISNVVECYINELQSNGHICLQFELDLREEVELEVVTMLRKTIYGHFNLDHFRKVVRERKKFQ